MKFFPRDVKPTGESHAVAFVARERGASVGESKVPTFPPSPNGKRLREARVRANLSLRVASERLGISAVEMAGLERGSHSLDTAREWEGAIELMGPAVVPEPRPIEALTNGLVAAPRRPE